MKAQVSINIEFSTFYEDHVIIPLIQMLLDGGWNFNYEDTVSYLSIEQDTFNWIRTPDVDLELMATLKKKN